MREIEFRAWDKTKKKFHDHNNLFVALDGSAVLALLDGDAIDTNDNFELTRFTGLTDKNGVKIFEGDILASAWDSDPISERENLCVVEWVMSFQSTSLDKDDEYPEPHVGLRFKSLNGIYDWKDFKTQYIPDRLKVIGNIYENKELLK